MATISAISLRGFWLPAPSVHVADACVDIVEDADKATLTLRSGRSLEADAVILAIGNDARPAIDGFPADAPWAPGSLDGLAPEAPVLVIGSGLTMVDMALSLDRRGHTGPIVVVSPAA